MTDKHINSRQAIRAAWDSRVDEYKDMLADGGHRAMAAASELAAFKKHLGSSGLLDVLDAGCGPGFHGSRLLDIGHRVTFVDVSPEMLKQARRSLSEQAASRATFLEADIRDLAALPASCFDAAISGGTVISDCGDPRAAVAEISRVLKPDGLFGFSVRNIDGPQQKGTPREVIRGGGPGFDWWFFSQESVQSLCENAGLIYLQSYPVLLDPAVPVAQEKENWRNAAWELFVIAKTRK